MTVYIFERIIKQNVCKFKPRINWIMDVQGKVGGLKARMSWEGEVKDLWDVQKGG